MRRSGVVLDLTCATIGRASGIGADPLLISEANRQSRQAQDVGELQSARMIDSSDRQEEINEVGWRDSRAAGRSIISGERVRILIRFLLFAVVSVVAFGLWRAIAGPLPIEERAVLLLLLLAVGFWVSEAIPAFAVGLFIIGFLVFAFGTNFLLDEPRDVAPYVDTWSSPVI